MRGVCLEYSNDELKQINNNCDNDIIKVQIPYMYQSAKIRKVVYIESLTKEEYLPLINRKCKIPQKFEISDEIKIQLILQKKDDIIKSNKVNVRR